MEQRDAPAIHVCGPRDQRKMKKGSKGGRELRNRLGQVDCMATIACQGQEKRNPPGEHCGGDWGEVERVEAKTPIKARFLP